MKKKNPATKTHMVRARITKEQRKKLDIICDEWGINESTFIRMCINNENVGVRHWP